MIRTSPGPGKTAAVYRVAYRRADRDPRKGYTYKLFKGEQQARLFCERLLHPVVTDKTPEKYRDLAPIAECHLHVTFGSWVSVEEDASNDLADHSGQVLIDDEYIAIDVATQRLRWLRQLDALNPAQQDEMEQLYLLLPLAAIESLGAR